MSHLLLLVYKIWKWMGQQSIQVYVCSGPVYRWSLNIIGSDPIYCSISSNLNQSIYSTKRHLWQFPGKDWSLWYLQHLWPENNQRRKAAIPAVSLEPPVDQPRIRWVWASPHSLQSLHLPSEGSDYPALSCSLVSLHYWHTLSLQL